MTAPALDRWGDPLPGGAVARLGTLRFRHPGRVDALAFSPDGRQLASGGSGNETVCLWEVESGRRLARLEGHREGWGVGALAYSPTGTFLACRTGRAVHLWDVTAAREIRRFQARGPLARSLAFSPGERFLAAPGATSGAHVWEVATGHLVAFFEGDSGEVLDVVFGEIDESFLTLGGDGILRLWDVERGETLESWRVPVDTEVGVGDAIVVTSVSTRPDGQAVWSAPAGGGAAVSVVRVREGRPALDLQDAGGAEFESVAFSANGKIIAASGFSGTIHLWDLPSGRMRPAGEGHVGGVDAIAFSTDGLRLAAGGSDGVLRVWDIESAETIARVALGEEISTVACSAQGGMIAVGGGSGGVRLLDSATSLPAHELESPALELARATPDMTPEPEQDGPPAVEGLALSPDRRLVAAGFAGGAIRVWEVASGGLVHDLAEPGGGPRRITLSPDGRWLASGHRIWDATSGRELLTFPEQVALVFSLAFSPDGTTLATGDVGWVRLWNAATGVLRLAIATPVREVVFALAFSPDGRVLASGSKDDVVRLWNVETGESLACLEGHEGWIRALAWSPDGRLLASGSLDGTVLLWSAERMDSSRGG
ncbi:MAG: WD40 repeat domain-containing protein [Planctomycetes bacterium]|nr:WD40 repeat domain-containing protein [Planctomycetota bacterium]